LEKTIAGIDEARRAGLDPVKINAVILRGRNDHEVVDLVRFAMDRGCTIRFLELMPIGCARAFFERLFVPAAEVRARLMAHFDLSPLTSEPGRTSREYRASDAAGRYGVVGFIAPESERFCAGCARLRLTSTGRIIRCLARNDGPSVKPLLGSESRAAIAALQRIVADEIDRKRAPASFGSASPMVSVGG
jgi:cyclic pyranopterin phosphate synthase